MQASMLFVAGTALIHEALPLAGAAALSLALALDPAHAAAMANLGAALHTAHAVDEAIAATRLAVVMSASHREMLNGVDNDGKKRGKKQSKKQSKRRGMEKQSKRRGMEKQINKRGEMRDGGRAHASDLARQQREKQTRVGDDDDLPRDDTPADAAAEAQLARASTAATIPQEAAVRANLGAMLHQRAGDGLSAGNAEALRHLTAALAMDPGVEATVSNLGSVLSALGLFDRAAAVYAEARGGDPALAASAALASAHGTVLAQAARITEAHAVFADAARAHPRDPQAACNLANAALAACVWDDYELHLRVLSVLTERSVAAELDGGNGDGDGDGNSSGGSSSNGGGSQPPPCVTVMQSLYLDLKPHVHLAVIDRAAREVFARLPRQGITADILRSAPRAVAERREESPAARKFRKFRIGFISYDLRAHPVGRLIRRVLLSLPRDRFEVVCLSVHPSTARVLALTEQWKRDQARVDNQKKPTHRSDHHRGGDAEQATRAIPPSAAAAAVDQDHPMRDGARPPATSTLIDPAALAALDLSFLDPEAPDFLFPGRGLCDAMHALSQLPPPLAVAAARGLALDASVDLNSHSPGAALFLSAARIAPVTAGFREHWLFKLICCLLASQKCSNAPMLQCSDAPMLGL
jgi:tetratricopeptide (TPR) repeat protein